MPRTKRTVAARGAEAEELSAPLVRNLDAVARVQDNLKTNAQRLANVKLVPHIGSVGGPFDWLEFYVFCLTIMEYVDMRPQPHDEIFQEIGALFPDLTFKEVEHQSFGIILVPRNCFKTVIFSVALPLYLLWKNPNSRGLLSAHRHDASKQYLRAVKWHIENNQKFIALCGNWKPQFKQTKWAEDAIIVTTRDKASVDPSIDTAGVDRSKVGAHPDWIICDDLHSDKNIDTAVMRNKVYDHIVAFYPMLQPGGTMIIVGTRWHNADAYGRLINEDKESAEQGMPEIYRKLVRSAYIEGPNKEKQLYFPERLTEKFLEDARRRFKSKFSLWYLNKPIADSDKLFPKEQLFTPTLRYYYDQDSGLPTIYRTDLAEEVPVSVSMAWDPAGISPSDESDFHGISIVCCDVGGKWYIPKAESFKGKPDKVLDTIINYIIMFTPEVLIIENVGQSGIWGHMLRQETERRGLHCPIIIYYTPPNRAQKTARISAALQPKWDRQEIIIDPRNRELIEQFDLFPQLDYDDVLDSVHMHIDYAKPPSIVDYFDSGDVLLPQQMKTLVPNARAKLGAYAGLGASVWGSMPMPVDDTI